MAFVKTKVEELPESRVRLEVEVPEADVRHAIEHAASDLAGSIRIPGFRKGKAPLKVVAARVGREALWREALESHLDGWFWSAAQTSGIQPVDQPEVALDEPPAEGDGFRFTATVAVLPKPELADWTTLEVAAPEPQLDSTLVDEELERLRYTVGELVPVDGRPVQPGDVVVLDLVGDDVPVQIDYVAEVGTGRLVEEIDIALVGMSAGETRTVDLPLADERRGSVEVTVKDVKERALPELGDELARATTEFDTLADLRADIESRLLDQLAGQLEITLREEAADALVEASRVETVASLVERRTAELATGLVRSLERRGVSLEMYVTMTGQSQEELVARLRAEADRSLQRELVLDAVADKLGLEVSDEEIEELVREQADELGDDPAEASKALRESGGFEKIRADLRLKKALDEVVAGVKRIPVELAHARDKLWTPEKEKGQTGMKIWTPGSKEST
jgi:trigger factor